MSNKLQTIIDAAWDDRDAIGATTTGEIRDAVDEALRQLDSGEARVATREGLGREPRERLAGTLAAIGCGVDAGAHILRVHDVEQVAEFEDLGGLGELTLEQSDDVAQFL